MGTLYRLDFANGKSYIGITTKAPEKRLEGHRRSTKYSDLAVHRAWRKHGEPTMRVMAIIEDADLAATEIRAIAAYGTLVPNGYNLGPGGDMSPMLNPIVAAKVSATNKGMAAAFKGPHSKEAKAKQRAAKLGRKLTAEHRAKIAAAGIGRMPTEATRAKLSAVHAGKPKSAEHRAKIASTLTQPAAPVFEPVALAHKAKNGRTLWSTCKHGHVLEGENLRITTEGKYTKRRCVECCRLRQQEHRAKKR